MLAHSYPEFYPPGRVLRWAFKHSGGISNNKTQCAQFGAGRKILTLIHCCWILDFGHELLLNPISSPFWCRAEGLKSKSIFLFFTQIRAEILNAKHQNNEPKHAKTHSRGEKTHKCQHNQITHIFLDLLFFSQIYSEINYDWLPLKEIRAHASLNPSVSRLQLR